MREPAKRGHGEGLRVSLLANCRISVWAANQRHPTAAAALRACHRATSAAHGSRRPAGPHNCADAQPPNDRTGNGGHEVGTRAEHLGRGSRHWEVGNASTPQRLNASTPQRLNPSTPPWLVPHHASLGPRPTSIPRDRGQPRPSSPPLLIRRRLPQEPRTTSCLVVPWCPPTPRCAIPQRKHK